MFISRRRSRRRGKMGQSWNGGGVRTLVQVLATGRQHLLCPHFKARDLGQIRWTRLREAGCRAVVFDKDNTLTAPYSPSVHPLVQSSFGECVSVFGKEGVVVFSNSAGSPDDPRHAEALQLERTLGVPVLRHLQKKPLGYASVREHFARIHQELHNNKKNPSPSSSSLPAIPTAQETVVVGDRYLTDVLFGNLHGLLTVHTRLLTAEGEKPIVKLIRRWEEAYVQHVLEERRQLKPPPHPLAERCPDLLLPEEEEEEVQ
ncbi:Phosphatidylglycerophosphatase gep4 mitochondrial [Balamuthia mandrillaris]